MSDTPEQVARRSGRHSWLEHPLLAHRYGQRGLIDGLRWEAWVTARLGGTLQNLLYNGIIHNFSDDGPESLRLLNAVADLEDTLLARRQLPSDFQLVIGRRRDRNPMLRAR